MISAEATRVCTVAREQPQAVRTREHVDVFQENFTYKHSIGLASAPPCRLLTSGVDTRKCLEARQKKRQKTLMDAYKRSLI